MNQHIIIDFEDKREQKVIKTLICPPRWACFGGKFATLAVAMTEFFQGDKFDLHFSVADALRAQALTIGNGLHLLDELEEGRSWGRKQPQKAVHSVAPEDQNLFLKFKFKLARCLVPGGTSATLSTLELDET